MTKTTLATGRIDTTNHPAASATGDGAPSARRTLHHAARSTASTAATPSRPRGVHTVVTGITPGV